MLVARFFRVVSTVDQALIPTLVARFTCMLRVNLASCNVVYAFTSGVGPLDVRALLSNVRESFFGGGD
jgi:hypothetical protein